jgi:predicted Na+-dependent transporter
MLTTIFLPIALGVIMLGLGLSLTTQDFKRVATVPKAAAVALGCQILLLPALCLGLVLLFDLAPPLAVGMLLLAAAPGGSTANLFSHLAGGDVALNITLTAINAVLAVITLPIVVNLALAGFLDNGDALGLQPDKMLQVVAIVLVPVAVGMVLRRRFPGFADRMLKPLKIAALVFMAATVAIAVYQERANIGGYVESIGVIALVLLRAQPRCRLRRPAAAAGRAAAGDRVRDGGRDPQQHPGHHDRAEPVTARQHPDGRAGSGVRPADVPARRRLRLLGQPSRQTARCHAPRGHRG